MESPQTVPKDTLDKQNTPPNLSIIVFKALSCKNGIEVPPTKRKCLKSSYLASLVFEEMEATLNHRNALLQDTYHYTSV
jgi:hypothetical protein